MNTSGYVVIGIHDEDGMIEYFNGSSIVAEQSAVKIFGVLGEARAMAGLLQKDYLHGEIAVRSVSIALTISQMTR